MQEHHIALNPVLSTTLLQRSAAWLRVVFLRGRLLLWTPECGPEAGLSVRQLLCFLVLLVIGHERDLRRCFGPLRGLAGFLAHSCCWLQLLCVVFVRLCLSLSGDSRCHHPGCLVQLALHLGNNACHQLGRRCVKTCLAPLSLFPKPAASLLLQLPKALQNRHEARLKLCLVDVAARTAQPRQAAHLLQCLLHQCLSETGECLTHFLGRQVAVSVCVNGGKHGLR